MTRSQVRGGRAVPRLEALEDRNLLSASEYVTSLYTDLLNRTPSSSEVAGWVSVINAGAPAAQVAASFTTSTEFRTNMIVDNYQRLLDRTPAASEVNLWLNALQLGLSETQMTALFLSSGEYLLNHGGGRVEDLAIGNWLDGVYEDVLGRPPDDAGRAAWTNALRLGNSRFQVSLAIATSREADVRVVDAVFADLLNRTPDAGGLNTFTAQLDAGVSPSLIAAQVAASTEYINLHASGTLANG